MNLARLTGWELKRLLTEKKTSSKEIMISILDEIDNKEQQVRAFITLRDRSELLAEADAIDTRRLNGDRVGLLDGLPVAVKDNICTKDLLTTCASKMLGNFIPPYDAYVVSQIRSEDGIIIGKTNMDEFAMGSSTENSSMHITHNPHNIDYVPGGTSGGSAAAVAANETVFAIGSDTGGSIRQPASYCGVVGIKPTYGRVSRYGLIAYGSSFDQIGVLSKDVYDAALLMNVIAGHDPNDSTSLPIEKPDLIDSLKRNGEIKIGVPEEFFAEGLNEEVRDAVMVAIDLLREDGHKVVPIRIPHMEYGIAAYYITVCCEASSNLARYGGIHYGFRSEGCKNIGELYTKSRSQGFGPEVRRRIMLGTYALSAGYYDAYYLTASKVRTILKHDFDEAFKKCDIIAHPVAPEPAFKIGEKTDNPLTMYLVDIYSAPANIVGIPAISIPCGWTKNGLPIGIQLAGQHLAEPHVFYLAHRLEKLLISSAKWIRS